MGQPDLGPGMDLAKRLSDLEDRVRGLQTRDVLQNASIGAGGLTITNGGSLTVSGSATFNGSLTVPTGSLNTGGNLGAGGNITAGGQLQGTNLNLTGGSGAITGAGAISGVSLNLSGNVAAASIIASGQVDSQGSPLRSQPSYNYLVATAYKGAWIDGATYQIGYAPSTEAVKKDLEPMGADVVDALLALTPYWGRYLWDDPDTLPKVFLLAAQVQAAGFGPDVAPIVEGEPLEMVAATGPIIGTDGQPVVIPVGEAYSLNYSQLVVPLLAAFQRVHTDLRDTQEALRVLTERFEQAELD